MRVPIIVAAWLMAGLFAVGCDGPGERAGEKIDEAVDDAGDAVEEACDDVADTVDKDC